MLLPKQQYRKILGMSIPGFSDEFIVNELKNTDYKQDIEIKEKNMIATTNANDFEQQINKFYKYKAEKKNQQVRYENNIYQIESVNLNSLSLTDRAYYLSYNPIEVIQSDSEAYKTKAMQNLELTGFTKKTEENGQEQISWIMSINVNPNQKAPIVIQPVINLHPEKFCTCKKEYKGEFMVKCSNEKCEYKWFHPKCADLTDEDLKRINEIEFFCKDCKNQQQ